MLINNPVSREKWRELLAALAATKSALFLPEYSEDNDRSLNYRYYR